MRSRLTPLSVLGFVVMAPATALCQVEEVEPFEGELSEGFESFGLTFETEIELFGGAALLRGTSGPPAVFVVSSSSIADSPRVFARTGSWFGGIGEPSDWIFATPVRMFGGYFATNSGAADALAEFFDAGDNLIASEVISIPNDQTWTWSGWTSAVPIKRIRMTGNGINRGFIDFDDMELSHSAPDVPTISQWGVMSLGMLLITAMTIRFGRLSSPRSRAGR